MKKLFTLMAAALFAVGISASTPVEGAAKTWNFTGAWNWQTVAQLATGDFTTDLDAKTASDASVTYFDASAYDYLCIKFSEATCDVGVYLQYKCKGTIDTNNNPEFDQDQVIMASETKGVAAIKLSDAKNTINSISVMNRATTGSIVIEEMYWATAAEYEAAIATDPITATSDKEIALNGWGWGWSAAGTVADGICTITLSGDNGAYSTGWDPRADWSLYKYLVAVVESYSSESEEPFLQIHAKGDNDTKIVAHEEIAQTFTAQKTFVMELDATYSGAVAQLWFQGKAAGDVIKVSKLYLTNTKPDVDEGGDDAPATLIDYPTKQDGITVSGTCEFSSVKIHNADAIDGIKFNNSYTADGALNANYVTLEVDGGFKKGDKIEIAGAFNNSSNDKKAAVDLFSLDGTTPTVLFTTAQFINGKTVDADPISETYTLAADAEKLYLGRNGNTATFVTLLKIVRETATGI